MSPFDQNIDYDAGHAIDPSIDQDDLIAFHLHDLSPQQERALHRVLRTSPTLQSESVAIATTLRAFPKHEAALPLDTAALERHWLALRPSLTIHVPPTIAPPSLFPRSLFSRWALPAFAGSALVATVLLVSLHHYRRTPPTTVATTQSPTSTAPSIPLAALSNSTPTSAAPTSGPTLIASTQRPWLNNPSSLPPSAPTQTALAKPSTTPLPTEPLAPTPPTQVSPATTTNPTTATTESPSPQSTNPTSPTSPSPTQLSKLRPPTIHHPHTTDVTLAIFGEFTTNRSSSFTSGAAPALSTDSSTQTTTSAVGALASFHQQLRPWLGYRVAASYTRPTFNYTYQASIPAGTSLNAQVNRRIYEFAGTYVAQGPHLSHLSTSAEVGVGLLAFIPQPNQSEGNAFRASAIAAIGMEYALTKHLSVRAEYRAQLYKTPVYHYPAGYDPEPVGINSVPTNNNAFNTFSSEPIVGITYRFGATGHD